MRTANRTWFRCSRCFRDCRKASSTPSCRYYSTSSKCTLGTSEGFPMTCKRRVNVCSCSVRA
nr:MAG: hypothetical protein [Molluscum contagiosum virus]